MAQIEAIVAEIEREKEAGMSRLYCLVGHDPSNDAVQRLNGNALGWQQQQRGRQQCRKLLAGLVNEVVVLSAVLYRSLSIMIWIVLGNFSDGISASTSTSNTSILRTCCSTRQRERDHLSSTAYKGGFREHCEFF